MKIDLLSTIKGSHLEGFFPAGWDLKRMDDIAGLPREQATRRAPHWHPGFSPIATASLNDFEVEMGLEIARVIHDAKSSGRQIAMIVPVGPMGMYRWAIRALQISGTRCDHVHAFTMDEWSDADGNTLPGSAPGSFQGAMEAAFYEPLGDLTVPVAQRYYASLDVLPEYAARIEALRRAGAMFVVVYGIGRAMHIAFWEPNFAAEYETTDAWRAETHRIAAKLHPLTIEQNAITSFKSRTTLVSAYANTVGPGLFLNADYAIGGADGVLGRGMCWQGLSLKVTLQYGPDPWVTSSFMPTIPGRLFYLEELSEALDPECN